jgi:predicted DsbA family dithiol-disulfide isomerase
MQVEPGTVVVYTDIVCGWSTVAISRFRAARERLGLRGTVRLEHRLFLLEDLNRAPTSKRLVESEIPVLGPLAPELGWKPWQQDPSTWAVSSLLANEAVHAAKRQGGDAAEELDFALRLAFFRDSRCITMRHEILAVAAACPAVDEGGLRETLDRGTARGPMLAEYEAQRDGVTGSPHFFLPDGSDVHNPGIDLHWNGDEDAGYPVVDRDDPTVWDSLVSRAAERVGSPG